MGGVMKTLCLISCKHCITHSECFPVNNFITRHLCRDDKENGELALAENTRNTASRGINLENQTVLKIRPVRQKLPTHIQFPRGTKPINIRDPVKINSRNELRNVQR